MIRQDIDGVAKAAPIFLDQSRSLVDDDPNKNIQDKAGIVPIKKIACHTLLRPTQITSSSSAATPAPLPLAQVIRGSSKAAFSLANRA